jgi:arsenite methyltransferase
MLADLTEFRDTVLDNARISSGETVADVGPGIGLLTLGAVERVGDTGEVLAIDISVDALEELRRGTSAPNIAYLVGSADVLPLPDESVDVVVTRSVLIYVADKAEAAGEFFRVLRPGGRVSIFEPINSRSTRLSEAVDFGDRAALVTAWEAETYGRPDDSMLNFDDRDLERFFEQAGFRDVRVDLRSGETEMAAKRMLTMVGAPGRKSILEVWEHRFAPEQVEELVAAVRAQEPIRRAWPQLYLTGVKS